VIRSFILCVCLFALLLPQTAHCADVFSNDGQYRSLPANQQPSFLLKYIINKPCSLVCFVDKLSRSQNKGWLDLWFDSQCRSDPSLENFCQQKNSLLADYKKMIDCNNQEVFEEPTGRKLSLSDKLIALASESSDLPEFLAKAKGIANANDYRLLQKTFEQFDNPYEKLIWQPRLPSLKQQLKEFQEQAAEQKMTERLATVQHFMQSNWKTGLPITIVLMPLPEPPSNKRSTVCRSLGALQTVELLPETKFRDKSDVLFHELCHAFWFAKPDHEKFEAEFQMPQLGLVPMTEQYEGMATAIAQGWYSKASFGHSPKNWYSDQIINRYAHLLAPLYASYLNEGKPIDLQFARKAAVIYFTRFPGVARDVKATSGFLIVLQREYPGLEQLRNDLSKAMPRSREMSFCFFESPKTIEDYHSTSAVQMAVLLAHKDLNELTELGLSAAQITELQEQYSDTANIRLNNRRFLVCIADKFAEQELLLRHILKSGKWPAPINEQ